MLNMQARAPRHIIHTHQDSPKKTVCGFACCLDSERSSLAHQGKEKERENHFAQSGHKPKATGRGTAHWGPERRLAWLRMLSELRLTQLGSFHVAHDCLRRQQCWGSLAKLLALVGCLLAVASPIGP